MTMMKTLAILIVLYLIIMTIVGVLVGTVFFTHRFIRHSADWRDTCMALCRKAAKYSLKKISLSGWDSGRRD